MTTETKSSNPAAFPAIGQIEDSTHIVNLVQEGMTLRDWFAGQFMAALINGPSNMGFSGSSEMAGWAYQHSDAMLKARETKAAPSPAYAPWTGALWPLPPGIDEGRGNHSEAARRRMWVMRYNGGSMQEIDEPTDAELRRYVGEVMAGGPGFAGAKQESK